MSDKTDNLKIGNRSRRKNFLICKLTLKLVKHEKTPIFQKFFDLNRKIRKIKHEYQ